MSEGHLPPSSSSASSSSSTSSSSSSSSKFASPVRAERKSLLPRGSEKEETSSSGSEISKLSGSVSTRTSASELVSGYLSDSISGNDHIEEEIEEIKEDLEIKIINGVKMSEFRPTKKYPRLRDPIVITSFSKEYIFFSGNRGSIVLFNTRTNETINVAGCSNLAIIFIKERILYVGVAHTKNLYHQHINNFLADPEPNISKMEINNVPLISSAQAVVSDGGIMYYISEHKLVGYNIQTMEYKYHPLVPHITLATKLRCLTKPTGPLLDWIIRRRTIVCKSLTTDNKVLSDSEIEYEKKQGPEIPPPSREYIRYEDSNNGSSVFDEIILDEKGVLKNILAAVTLDNSCSAINIDLSNDEWEETAKKLKGTPTVELHKGMFIDWTGLITYNNKKCVELAKQYPLAPFTQPLRLPGGKFFIRLKNLYWATVSIQPLEE